MQAWKQRVLRAVRVGGGALLLLIGVALMVLPGPGIPLVLAGLLLLEREFHWAGRLRRRLVGAAAGFVGWAKSALRRASERLAYGLAFLPVLTDWLDAGHWPAQPRELITEAVIGSLIFAGVHHLYARAERFRAASETDPLTGLGNRARFRRDIEAAVERARAEGGSLVLAYVDVDAFKGINDGLGHAAGDQALRDVARALARSVREGADRCYRLGGDEFAVILAGLDEARAVAALRRGFRKRMAHPLSCSVGVARLADGEGPDGLVGRADRLMYRSKRGEPAGEGLVAKLGADLVPSHSIAA